MGCPPVATLPDPDLSEPSDHLRSGHGRSVLQQGPWQAVEREREREHLAPSRRPGFCDTPRTATFPALAAPAHPYDSLLWTATSSAPSPAPAAYSPLIYALPEGTLPPELDDAIEDLLMPGYRQRVMAAYLASLPAGEHLQ